MKDVLRTLLIALLLESLPAYPAQLDHHDHLRHKRNYITAMVNNVPVSWADPETAPTQTAAPAAPIAPPPADPPTANDVQHNDPTATGKHHATAITLVDNTTNHAYTLTVRSTAPSPRQIIVWNKVGPDNQPNSGQSSGTPTLSFSLAPAEEKVLAFDEDTQGALCDFTTGRLGQDNVFVCPWVEFNFAPATAQGRRGWSAYDVSVVEMRRNGMNDGCNVEVSAPGTAAEVSNCQRNFYYKEGLPSGMGGTVADDREAHFMVVVGG